MGFFRGAKAAAYKIPPVAWSLGHGVYGHGFFRGLYFGQKNGAIKAPFSYNGIFTIYREH
ncbi:hypothetical protein GCM10027170_33390 [Aliiglaciecola aliphaticivorans]